MKKLIALILTLTFLALSVVIAISAYHTESKYTHTESSNDMPEKVCTADLISGTAKIATGTYAGNDAESVTLTFGFKPVMVVVRSVGIQGFHPDIVEPTGDGAPVWAYGFIWTGQEYMWVIDGMHYAYEAGCVDFEPFDTGLKFGSLGFMGEEKILNAINESYEYFAIGY